MAVGPRARGDQIVRIERILAAVTGAMLLCAPATWAQTSDTEEVDQQTTSSQQAQEAGRDPDALEVCAGARDDVDAIGAMADRGVHHVYIVVGEPTLEAATARLHDIGERVLGRF